MRNRAFATLSLLLLLAAASAAYAQDKLIADVPFDFTAGKKVLPAGTYTVDRDIVPDGAVWIRRQDNSATVIALSHAVQASERVKEAKLVFHRYGNRYFLSEIWPKAKVDGRQLRPSAAEREMMAKGIPYDRETVVARKR